MTKTKRQQGTRESLSAKEKHIDAVMRNGVLHHEHLWPQPTWEERLRKYYKQRPVAFLLQVGALLLLSGAAVLLADWSWPF